MSEPLKPMVVNGRYRLEEPIGSGGFGKTWRATDELLGMPVAVKAFAASDGDNRDRYLREARNLAQFWQEPGIVAVRDYFEADGAFYLVMEYLEGEDLAARLKRTGPLALDETLALLAPVMQTLEHLHAAGVIHRDVSPDNLRILPNGQMKLLDFGSALSTNSAKPGATVTVKPGYAPPEQYGDVEAQGPWTDVYALSATIWQCLTGRKPMDSLQRTFHDELPAPSSLGAHIAPVAETALMRALALDPRERLQSVDELRRGLTGQTIPTPAGAATAAPVAPPATEQPPVLERPSADLSQNVATLAPEPESGEPGTAAKPTPNQDPPVRKNSHHPKHPPTREPQNTERKRPRINGAIIGGILAAVAVVALIAVGMFAIGNANTNPYRAENTHYSRLMDTAVGLDALDAIARDGETNDLTLIRCQVDDAAIAKIAEMDNIQELYLQECVGYSSLEPLASSTSLYNIYISGYDGFEGDTMMPVEFPNITKLTFDTVRFKGTSGFLCHFPAIETLRLSPTEGIDNIEFLRSCPNITSVTFDGIDLSGDTCQPLALCSNLGRASLNACKLETLTWAKSCPKLGELEVSNNALTSLDGLQGHEKLYKIYAQDNQIDDLSPLSGTTGLISVACARNNISDANALGGNTLLYSLDLAENDLDDAGMVGLANCSELENLGLAGNRLTNLDFCERMIKLDKIDVSSNAITKFGKLSSCSNLRFLLAHHNKLTNIEELGNYFEALIGLNISYNQIRSLKPLELNHTLRYLVANENAIENLDGLQDKPELEDVLLYGNKITDTSGLKGSVGSLSYLDLGNNQVSDVSVLADFGSQKEHFSSIVLLERNKIADASMLPTDRKWRAIALYENPLESISFLAQEDMSWNATYISHSDAFDYTEFASLHALSTLRLVDVPYDLQAKILRDRNDNYSWQEPAFITLAQADSELAELRERINRAASLGTGESSEEEDADSEDAGSDVGLEDDADANARTDAELVDDAETDADA